MMLARVCAPARGRPVSQRDPARVLAQTPRLQLRLGDACYKYFKALNNMQFIIVIGIVAAHKTCNWHY